MQPPQQTGSAPRPHRQQNQPPPSLPRQLEPACHQPANKKMLFACVILDYCSVSCSHGEPAYAELVVSVLPLSLAAEAEPPPGFDPTLCNFDGQRPGGGGGVGVWKKALGSVYVCFWKASFQKRLSAQTALPLEGKPSLVAGAIAKINPKSAAFSSKAVHVCIPQIRQWGLAGSCLRVPLLPGVCEAPIRSNDVPSKLHHGLVMAGPF